MMTIDEARQILDQHSSPQDTAEYRSWLWSNNARIAEAFRVMRAHMAANPEPKPPMSYAQARFAEYRARRRAQPAPR